MERARHPSTGATVDLSSRGLPTAVTGLALGALIVGGCTSERRFLGSADGGLFAIAITPETPAYFESDEDALYLVEAKVDVPVRLPTTEEAATIGAMTPWVDRGDYELELDFTVSYASVDPAAEPVLVTVQVNGVSQDREYVPGVSADNEGLIIDFSQWERTYLLRPGQRQTVTVREQELDEVAVDLASVGTSEDCAAIANTIVFFQNQSDRDPRSRACVPPVVPALVSLRLGLRAEGSTPPPIALEATVRARDVHDRVAPTDAMMLWVPPAPALFTPPVVED